MTAKRWRGRWVADFTLDGKRIRRVSPVQTRKGAEAFEAELRSACSRSTGCSGPTRRKYSGPPVSIPRPLIWERIPLSASASAPTASRCRPSRPIAGAARRSTPRATSRSSSCSTP